MIRHDKLRKWLAAPKHDMARLLTANDESCTGQRPDALPAGNAREFGQTATTIVSKGSAGTGIWSSSSAATYSRMAARALTIASSRVFPWETQPGRLGHS